MGRQKILGKIVIARVK